MQPSGGEISLENEEQFDRHHGELDCVDKYSFVLRVVRLVAAPLNPTYVPFSDWLSAQDFFREPIRYEHD